MFDFSDIISLFKTKDEYFLCIIHESRVDKREKRILYKFIHEFSIKRKQNV